MAPHPSNNPTTCGVCGRPSDRGLVRKCRRCSGYRPCPTCGKLLAPDSRGSCYACRRKVLGQLRATGFGRHQYDEE